MLIKEWNALRALLLGGALAGALAFAEPHLNQPGAKGTGTTESSSALGSQLPAAPVAEPAAALPSV